MFIFSVDDAGYFSIRSEGGLTSVLVTSPSSNPLQSNTGVERKIAAH